MMRTLSRGKLGIWPLSCPLVSKALLSEGYNATYLLPLSVTIEDNTSDLVLDRLRQLLNGAVVDGSALTVATSDDNAVGAFACHVVEGVLHQSLAAGIGAARQNVGGNQSCVVDAFSGNLVPAKDALETVRGGRTDDGTLFLSVIDCDLISMHGVPCCQSPSSHEPRQRGWACILQRAYERTRSPSCLSGGPQWDLQKRG